MKWKLLYWGNIGIMEGFSVWGLGFRILGFQLWMVSVSYVIRVYIECRVILGLYWSYMGMMENNMETTIYGLEFS